MLYSYTICYITLYRSITILLYVYIYLYTTYKEVPFYTWYECIWDNVLFHAVAGISKVSS